MATTTFNDNNMDISDSDEAMVSHSMSSEINELKAVPKKYEVLNVEQIVQMMNRSVDEVKSVIELPPNVIRVLLNHFKWDKQRLYDRYYDGSEEKLFEDAHINTSFNNNVNNKSITDQMFAKRIKKLFTCFICYNDVQQSLMLCLCCNHEFCTNCWQQYLTSKIVNEGVCNGITCPQNRCDIIVDDEIISKIIKDSKVIAKYQHLITNSFVATNRFLRWCPGSNCLNAIKVNYVDFIAIDCNCGAYFCFLCGEKWHEPTRCNILKSWNKKCLGETNEKIDCETANWILSYTKECPKCSAPIEKNGGCNHMSCRNAQCKHEFCWLCMADWSKHGYQQSCNRYEESEKTQTARAKLQRYIHYWTRYHNHQQSLNSEKKFYEEVNIKMEELQLRNMTWVEVQFLKTASDVLCKCRQTLMFSYPFAFYLAKSNPSAIFEDNQADLEMSTEKLSEYLERDINQIEDIKTMKTSILDITKYCEKRRKVLVDHVYEGYDSDIWEFYSLD